ncbi:MAG: proline dehydrogenase family protein [Acidobacteriota bacterium]
MLRPLISWGLPFVPKFIVGRVAKKYVAGATVEEALACVDTLNQQGFAVTLALLGEEVTQRDKATAAVEEYQQVLRALSERGADANVSIKLTLLGLKIDLDFCRESLREVLGAASEVGNFARIDMEDHTCTDDTLRLYQESRQELGGHVGIVLQAYLKRTLSDIAELGEGINARLCKGIYIEPRRIAWKDYETVRLNFIHSLERLFEQGAYVGIATHDEYLVAAALGVIQRMGLAPDRYEFQTLLGVDEEMRDSLRDLGHRVRVYVPYGQDWYPYSVRRLRENPQIAVYVMRAMLGRS